MRIRSIRWRLQLWYTILLLVVVAGFATLLYLQTRRARLQEIDAELLGAARLLEGALRAPPPPKGRDRPPPPRGLSLPGRPDLPNERGLWFVVWRPNGEVLRASPGIEELPVADESEWPPGPGHRVRRRGPFREVLLRGPRNTRILVGRSVERPLAELRALAWQLGLTGLGVWAVGLAGGWWLSRQALRPLAAISATAAEISATNLSRRIEVAETQSELGELAGVLNDAFARLQSAFELQVRFTADASHELRTPLSVILSQAELALARPRSEPEYQDALESCRRAAQRMRSLVESLLTLARIDSGELRLDRQSIDLGELTAECVELVRPLAQERGLRLEATLPAIPVSGDAERLGQVVTNLLGNAITYNRPGGSIEVTLSEEAGAAVLRVADTGIGIATENVQHLFERFYRVDPARSRAAGGSGLGLAICKSIVEGHGGTIEVQSTLGEGTTVTVRLPRRGGDVDA